MKKLLGIFGAMGFIASISSNVVSCGNKDTAVSDFKQTLDPFIPSSYPKTIDDLKTLGSSCATKFNSLWDAFTKDLKDAGMELPSGDDQPTSEYIDFVISNNNAQQNAVIQFLIESAYSYVLFNINKGLEEKDQIQSIDLGNNLSIDSLDKTDTDGLDSAYNAVVYHNSNESSPFSDKYKTYYDSIYNWAIAYN